MNKIILKTIEKIAYAGANTASTWYIYQPKTPDCLLNGQNIKPQQKRKKTIDTKFYKIGNKHEETS